MDRRAFLKGLATVGAVAAVPGGLLVASPSPLPELSTWMGFTWKQMERLDLAGTMVVASAECPRCGEMFQWGDLVGNGRWEAEAPQHERTANLAFRRHYKRCLG